MFAWQNKRTVTTTSKNDRLFPQGQKCLHASHWLACKHFLLEMNLLQLRETNLIGLVSRNWMGDKAGFHASGDMWRGDGKPMLADTQKNK